MPEEVSAVGAVYHPSPNYGERRGGLRPSLVVVHYTAMPSAALALERLCDPVWEVSAHWLIGRKGQLWSLVPESRRAWHAGAGSWGGAGDVNSRSIGIEIDNDGHSPFTHAAMLRLAELLRQIQTRWSLPPEAVIGHSDMAPLRKGDPGPRFDWRWLAMQGLSVWPKGADPIGDGADGGNLANREKAGQGAKIGVSHTLPEGADAAFLRDAARFGYPAELGLEPILSAMRLRFRPSHHGPLDRRDLRIMADLAESYPATSAVSV